MEFLRVLSLQDSHHTTEQGECLIRENCQFWRHSLMENSFYVEGIHFILKFFTRVSSASSPPELWQRTIWLLSFCSMLHLGALAFLLQDVRTCHCPTCPRHRPLLFTLPKDTILNERKKNSFHFFLISILVNIQKQIIKADGKQQDPNQYIFGRGFT